MLFSAQSVFFEAVPLFLSRILFDRYSLVVFSCRQVVVYEEEPIEFFIGHELLFTNPQPGC